MLQTRRLAAAVLLLLLLGPSCAGRSAFTRILPPGVPSVSGWEKSAGWVELDEPRRLVEYELYVAPERPNRYGVVRYRITVRNRAERLNLGIEPTEKLQWDMGTGLRRWELATAAGVPTWRELPRGSEDYQRETALVISVYFLHRELLFRRDGAGSR